MSKPVEKVKGSSHMNTREFSMVFGSYKIVNTEWECSSCKKWSNYVSWFCAGYNEGVSITTCPKCLMKLEG